jgi:hypothetical protein
MKQDFASQSGIFKLRVCVALLLCSVLSNNPRHSPAVKSHRFSVHKERLQKEQSLAQWLPGILLCDFCVSSR